MASEAVIVQLNPNANPIEFTVASGVAIAKGTLLKLADPRTVSASAADSDVYGGVAAAAKADNDDATTLSAHVPGAGNIFTMVCGIGITAGAIVSLSGVNLIKPATSAEILTGDQVGKALETGAVSEAIEVLS